MLRNTVNCIVWAVVFGFVGLLIGFYYFDQTTLFETPTSVGAAIGFILAFIGRDTKRPSAEVAEKAQQLEDATDRIVSHYDEYNTRPEGSKDNSHWWD